MRAVNTSFGTAHVLYWLKAEGSPRLALSLVREELLRTGIPPVLIVLVRDVEDSIEKAFTDLGVQVHYVGWNRDFGKLIFRIIAALKKLKPAGVICYSIGVHVSVGVAATWQRLRTLVHIGNAPPQDRTALKKIKLQFQVGRPFITRHIACSRFVRQACMEQYGMPARSILAVPNGIDLERFFALRSQRQPRKPDEPCVIGMVASFEMHKDQDVLLQALQILKSRGFYARLRLVGHGSRFTTLQKLADDLDIASLIDWVGIVDDVRPELLAMDVFAYAVHPQEGLGIALIEAMASGLPAVGSDVGACQEVLDWGKLGPLIRNRDPQAWADALLLAALQPPTPREAFSQYDIRQTANAYFQELYQNENGPVSVQR